MEPSGYPAYFLLAVIIVGLFFIVTKPYWAFLFAIVLFGTVDQSMAILTRFQIVGPYFNLYDALFIIALLSIIRDAESSPLHIPRPVEWILLIIIIGILQTLLYYQMTYLVLRSLRWSITLPLAFFISANAVSNQDRAKSFFYAIILGSVLNAIISFIQYKGLVMLHPADNAVRMAGAGNLLGVSLLVAALQQAFFPTYSLAVKLMWGAVLLLLALTVLFGQWRSVFVGVVLSMICVPIVLRRWEIFIRGIILVIIGVPLIFITLYFSLPSISGSGMMQRFFSVTKYLSLNRKIPKEDMGRVRQMQRDLEEWSKGNWIIGQGYGFNTFLPDATDPTIAWGHVGYTWYLSQFGLLGLVIYGIYLPLQVLRAGKEVYFGNRGGPIGNLGLLTIVTVIFVSIICFMSFSYLLPCMHSVGFLYGVAWSLAYGKAGLGKAQQVMPG